eukprot:199721-Chlamydomonas_euryale.AAC.1
MEREGPPRGAAAGSPPGARVAIRPHLGAAGELAGRRRFARRPRGISKGQWAVRARVCALLIVLE